MKKQLLVILALLLLAVPFIGSSDAQGNRSCSDRDFRGGYGFSFDGHFLTENGALPVAAVGILNADGQGNVTAVRTLNLNGQVFEQTAVGTYETNPNCTGTSVFEIFTPGLPDTVETFTSNLNRRSGNIQFVGTDDTVVAQGTAWKQ